MHDIFFIYSEISYLNYRLGMSFGADKMKVLIFN